MDDYIYSELNKSFWEDSNLENKFIIFAAYLDIYDSLTCVLKENTAMQEIYGEFLKATLLLCLISANLKNEANPNEKFLETFLNGISVHEYSKWAPIAEKIEYYQNNLDKLLKKHEYANVIKDMDGDFVTKTEYLIIVKNHINILTLTYNTLNKKIGEAKKQEVLDELIPLIPTLNTPNNDINEFKINLKSATKKILDRKIATRELNINVFFEGFLKEFVDQLDEFEFNIFKLGFIYNLAGYDGDVQRMTIKEYSQKLNMSKMRALLKTVTFAIKMAKFSVKLENENREVDTLTRKLENK